MMNLSSVLIVAKEDKIDSLAEAIAQIELCSVELREKDKLIVVIESDDLDSELKAYKKLEALPNLISINMVFSYQDLDEDIQKAINSGAIESIEKNEKAENITYNGSVFQKLS
ncbi:chaperone NapD [Campylobacter helveticus]|uniref:Chaperone NapD n=1 Tax=Campylobacter helveticus TaxID=28898 RepID=A0AAX2UIF0_9BACT|nr:chaperone NapD [Campylobacter helveticus]MCR2039316.1 chaperone NapD [Campylobacter helveticus]MCR2055292.1 chaperone NapD [Campylobacter helveticus]MCR2057092.1 chaperone NapD [Campylobacter helveticus]MCR2062798.1 chaperone NapD [Campylobacter helveticus]MCR2064218.1 chaperone NapD [Campylobacter helveticus]